MAPNNGYQTPPKLAAISVDLDEIPCYAAIHGLQAPHEDQARAIYRRALPRLLNLFANEGVDATFFAIGADLDVENGDRLREAIQQGHEIANHTLDHHYDLTRRTPAQVAAQIHGGTEAIRRATGIAPVGFRAPGYTINDTVFHCLKEQGYHYDSSVFPCWPYYSLKAAAMGLIRARGRRSQSILDTPRVLTSPASPYRVDQPYWRRGQGILEFPIGVTRFARLPFIGTSVVMGGNLGASFLTHAMLGRNFINLELHGIDLADAADDALEWLAPHQPDLQRTAQEKASALRTVIRILRQHGYRFVRLDEAASIWQSFA